MILAERDILVIRVERVQQLNLKSKVCHCIINGIKEMVASSEYMAVRMETDICPHLWSSVRNRPSNLDL